MAMSDPLSASVLIVEDEPDFRDMLTYQFSMKGFQTLSASTGAEALQLVWTHHVSAVVTDIRMPGMSGIELVHRIKSVDVYTPAVVLVSAYPDISPEEAYNEGAEGLFTKPFSLAEIVNTIARLAVPPPQRWRTTPPDKPLDELNIELADLESGWTQGLFGLGRGGAHLALHDAVPLTGQRIAFDVHLTDGGGERISGVGVVRWVRLEETPNAHPACGIEFEYLETKSCDIVTRWLSDRQLRPYIPSLHTS